MILKNILRRKGRTLLTVLGISIGVAAIIGLGALADGLQAGYTSLATGSKADLVLSQPNSMDVSLSSVDQQIEKQLRAMPEVKATTSLVEGYVQTDGSPYFFVFGYPEESFALTRFQVKEGVGLGDMSRSSRGKPLMLGSAASESLKKQVGDSLRLMDSLYRVVGIYETGDAFEDSGAVISLSEAQVLLGRPRQVSLFYIQLKSPDLRDRLTKRVERLWPDLLLSSTEDYGNKQMLTDMLRGFVWAVAGLAIIIGGIGMMNAQLMSVFERTREIGVLRAVGWGSRRVLGMILGETLVVCLLGGLVGVGWGWLMLTSFSRMPGFFGISGTRLPPDLLVQAFSVVIVLGLVGGLYPAWRAARLQPVEALRYEGGSGGNVRRLPVGGMAVQGLWQRSTRTFLTLGVIGLTVGAIIALEAIVRGFKISMNATLSADAEVVVRQADIADTSLSALDERVGDKIAAMPEVANVSGMIFTAIVLPESGGFFVVQGHAPNEFGIRRFNVVEGERLTNNHQIMLGRLMADAMKKEVGDTLDLNGSRYRVVGIYESGTGWEEMGGVVSLRDGQVMMGRPRKVTLLSVKVRNPTQAAAIAEKINAENSQAHATLAGEFAEELPDMKSTDGMMGGISLIAIMVGGMGVMNTMLMSVLERTREIGVLRALGWRRRSILGLILRESALVGLLGGLAGVGVAFGLGFFFQSDPNYGAMLKPLWEWDIFVRALVIALLLGLVGGLYPAWRATRLQPVEALRYE
jgi:ABC-type antimicrobial peptide transport system permease subunit